MRHYILFVLVAIILSLATFFAFDQRYQEAPPNFLYISYFIFAGLSIVSHTQLIKAARSESSQFVTVYMGLTAVKMFLILTILTIYLWFNKEHLFAVGVLYAGAYLLFLILDTTTLLKQLNSKK
jgi:hypothetical protein